MVEVVSEFWMYFHMKEVSEYLLKRTIISEITWCILRVPCKVATTKVCEARVIGGFVECWNYIRPSAFLWGAQVLFVKRRTKV